MPNSTPTFHLGLTMAGSVSAGCYTAGVVDYLFEILDLWDRAKKAPIQGIPDTLVPRHRVVIDAVGGTSGGAMAAMMTAIYALEGKINPVKYKPENPLKSQNLLYDSWVQLVDDIDGKELSFEKIWNLDDLNGPNAKVTSLFNSQFLEQIADETLTFEGARDIKSQVQQLPDYISPQLEVFISHAMLRGIPLQVGFQTKIGEDRHDSPAHTSFEHYMASHFQLNNGDSVNESEGHLWFNPYDPKMKEKIRLSTIATGAFPIGLKYRRFGPEHFSKAYFEKVAKRIVYGDFGSDTTHSEDDLQFNLPNDYSSLTVDGGAINNEPYREIESIVRRGKAPSDYGIIMIDPFPDRPKDHEEYQEPENMVEVTWGIISTLWDQSKVKRRETIEQFAEEQYIRGEIFPKRNSQTKKGDPVTTEEYPIASASFAAFGGFLDINFRVHDFFLGRNNARNFVRYFFSLPYYGPDSEKTHPIHRDWSEECVERFLIYKKKQKYLPIIPDLNIVMNNLSWQGEEWKKYDIKKTPQYDPQPLFDLESKMRLRYKKLLQTLIGELLNKEEKKSKDPKLAAREQLAVDWWQLKRRKGWFKRLKGKLFGLLVLLGKRPIIKQASEFMAETTIKEILKDLAKRDLLKPPKE